MLATAWHVLDRLGAGKPGDTVRIDALAGGLAPFEARVERVDPVHDLAALSSTRPLLASVPGLIATDSVKLRTDVVITGVSDVHDPHHDYRFLVATGWAGDSVRDKQTLLGRLRCRDVVPGMSGAPVCRDADGRVVGVISARYNSDDGWLRDSVWVARTERLELLLRRLGQVSFESSLPVIDLGPEWGEPTRLPIELSEYLTEAIGDTEYLAFGNPHRIGQANQLRLEDVWMPPDARICEPGREQALVSEHYLPHGQGPIQIDALLNMAEKAVVIGRPGYGKTTLCSRLTHKYAQTAKREGRGWIPLHVPLRTVNHHGVWNSMEELLTRLPIVQRNPELRSRLPRLSAQLQEAASRGRIWFFYDGLDEVDADRVAALRRRLNGYALASPNRVTITCRRADYDTARPSRRFADLPVLELDAFSE